MGITVTQKGRIVIPAAVEIAKVVAEYALSGILKRTAAGIDMHGKPFEKLSDEYAKARERSGRDGDRQSQLILSGGLLKGTKVQSVTETNPNRAVAIIAPSTAASRKVDLGLQKTRKDRTAAKKERIKAMGEQAGPRPERFDESGKLVRDKVAGFERPNPPQKRRGPIAALRHRQDASATMAWVGCGTEAQNQQAHQGPHLARLTQATRAPPILSPCSLVLRPKETITCTLRANKHNQTNRHRLTLW